MAGRAYFDTRKANNQFPLPENWFVDFRVPEDKDTGFEATIFKNTATKEIVISFAGTYDQSGVDKFADEALWAGVFHMQLLQACKSYLDVKANAPINTQISLTGHSLGGGLAALVAVYFGVNATTFDQAPFRSSTLSYNDRDVAAQVLQRLQSETKTAIADGVDKQVPRYSIDQLAGLNTFVSSVEHQTSWNQQPSPVATIR